MPLLLQPRQSQKQALSPAMWICQSLLTLPITELREEIRKEIDSNPALEQVVPRNRGQSANVADYVENLADDSRESLAEHLMSELRMGGVSGRELELCQAIIGELDANGHFKGSIPDLRMVTGASESELEAARRRVMVTDPVGCGAKDIGECYRAQLGIVPENRRKDVEQAIDVIVDALNSGRLPNLRFDAQILACLRKMNPYPGRLYDSRKTEFVVPDIRVDEDGDIDVDQSDIPELYVSQKYIEMAKDKSLDEETRQFAIDRVQRARDFREAVIRRLDTMKAVAEIAIAGQSEYLKHGVASMRRQTMSEVAKKAKCSVATVSRAAARKYVRTPRGTIPFRKFFALVDQKPIERLREILESIPPGESKSDREISELMTKSGFTMARRTVAKYRKLLSV